MDRKIVQDIVPSARRQSSSQYRKRIDVEEDEPVERVPIRRIHSASSSRGIPPKRKFSALVLTFCVIFLSIGVIALAASLLYSKASVTITPKQVSFNISETTFTAKKDVAASATSSASSITSGLMYEVIKYSDSLSQSVVGTDGPLIETKAKGAAVLYNEQKVQQKIVAGTRLSTNDGLIYRTTGTVTIPADKTSPGSVWVGIIADKAGAEYNLTAGSNEVLKVVAYKDGPKYSTVYGKVKTNPSGGYSGSKKIISAQVQRDAIKTLKDSMKTKLVEKIKSLVPKGYILYDTANVIEYEIPEPISDTKDSAVLTVNASIYGVIFKTETLIKSIAKRELDKVASLTYKVKGMEDLNFSIMNLKDFAPQKGTPLVFTLKGPVTITSTLSEEALKNELKGTYLKDVNAIFAHYPAIGNAYAQITPFWMRSFPNDPNKISIEMKEK